MKHGTTDIILSDFSVPAFKPSLNQGLQDYENSIEVHLLHLTHWRDYDYRKIHAMGKDVARDRRDWDKETALLVELILNVLNGFQSRPGRGSQRSKNYTPTGRYKDKAYTWPANLAEKSDVQYYLASLGL